MPLVLMMLTVSSATKASAAQPAAGRPPLAPRHATASGPPVVVELFTAQGCTGCAEADQAIKGVIGRPNVLVLAFPVDYWDYLGWKDTFARPEFTQRQAAYKSRFKLRET